VSHYMDEPPYPEFEAHWERPEADPCPNCQCCSARLCMRAVMDGKTCGQIAAAEDYRIVAECLCCVPGVKP
jgi:hypothetical protein